MGKKQDREQQRAGQIDGSRGELFGTRGNPFDKDYGKGFDEGRFVRDRERFGDTWARALKAERDIGREISNGDDEDDYSENYDDDYSPGECSSGDSRDYSDFSSESRSYKVPGWGERKEVDDEPLTWKTWFVLLIGAVVSIVYLVSSGKFDLSKIDDGTDSMRNFELKGLNPDRETKSGLKKLARNFRNNGGWTVTINDYCEAENNIWAVGSYSNMGGGFICYSPDKGTTWYEQAKSEPTNADGIPFGIYFFDSNEGWTFTRKGILHTRNGGSRWDWSCRNDGWFLRQLHIVDRNIIIAEDIPRGRMIYTLNGGRSWRIHEKWEPEALGLKVELVEKNETGLYVYE